MTVGTILVVEDEPLLQLLAVETLEEAGWTVVSFTTADQAIDFWKSDRSNIDAVFTDINMPGSFDGIDLATLVNETVPPIAVIITSGRYLDAPVELASRVRFLRKPWTSAQLLSALGNIAS